MFQHLLICTDFNDGIERLIKFVPQLAQSGAQKLVFLHSVPLDGGGEIPQADRKAIQAAQEVLAPALKHGAVGVEVVVEVDSGNADRAILAAVQKHAIDLVIFGSSTRSLLTQKLFGSTASSLASKLNCPLLTCVRPSFQPIQRQNWPYAARIFWLSCWFPTMAVVQPITPCLKSNSALPNIPRPG
ncbi:MAG: universal stress protein [Synechococcales cyanobacterium RU_4_20]|nr:universal stress protein [Synechococcales cyanobacterium RU_4_20]